MKKLICVLLVLVLALSCFAGCKEEPAAKPVETTPAPDTTPADTTPEVTEPEGLEYAEGTTLRMATGYNNAKTGLWFDADTAKDGITLSDGVTYHTGDLKPTWVEVEKLLGIKLTNQYQGNSATNEFKYWQDRLNEVDVVSVNLNAANEAGVDGKLVNIAEHLDKMPNFKAYLEANPIVRLSITGDTATGAIYVAPYFDGVNDIERMPLMRTDWVEKLLNGEGEFTATASDKLAAAVYTPYMPTSGKVAVDVVEADGKTVKTINKDYDAAGNIVAKMNEALAAGEVDGVAAVNMLRTYIDTAYAGYYGTNRADLFIGQNAAWDADELVALLRCVVANSATLNADGQKVQGIFSREDSNNQRRVDMYRFAGHLFGVRGLESRNNWIYVDTDGKVHDARQEVSTYEAMERMYAMTQEGLISSTFVQSLGEKTETMLANDIGFMHYDYNQTQTIYNDTKLQEGECYRAVMVPVARWYDGTNADGVYMRFTESWRSVKTDAWAISVAGVAGDENKLNAALAIFDFAYSPEGQILMSYGPEAFRSTETFLFNGAEMPKISEGCYNDLMTLTKGNYTNFARQYLGSTLAFAKSQAFEFQCTNAAGQLGAGYISNAIAAGTIKHPELGLPENMWYASMPTELGHTDDESTNISDLTSLGNENFGTAKNQGNIFVDQICKGYSIDGVTDAASAANMVANNWGGKVFLMLKQAAFDRQVAYYNELVK
ncbi:MAG: hypothetical protein IJN53_02660 [Oscillospiraceae bacterium]|nr:hypothetical protein [Oscillospiraceae bacterium]